MTTNLAQSGTSLEPCQRTFDIEKMTRACYDIIDALGEDVNRTGLRETPQRFAKAFAEIFSGLLIDPRETLNKTFSEQHKDFIFIQNIDFYSMCEHHLLPIIGTAHVGYLPNEDGSVTGLSKIARLVEAVARKPQIQERITREIADTLVEVLAPRGVIVIVEAQHLCMQMRGIKNTNSVTKTSAFRGMYADSIEDRKEALALLMS